MGTPRCNYPGVIVLKRLNRALPKHDWGKGGAGQTASQKVMGVLPGRGLSQGAPQG